MPSPDEKIDQEMHAYSQKWLKSLGRRRPASTSLGYFFVGYFIFLWASSLTSYFGYSLTQGLGALIFVGIGLALLLVTILVNSLFARLEIPRPIRSALWLSALVGSYVAVVSLQRWDIPLLSHLAGVASALLVFWLSHQLDRFLAPRLPKD